MNPSEISTALVQFVVEQLLDGDGTDLDDTTPLLELAILDSMGINLLLGHIERTFGVEVPSELLTPANLRDLKAIATLVEKLRG